MIVHRKAKETKLRIFSSILALILKQKKLVHRK